MRGRFRASRESSWFFGLPIVAENALDVSGAMENSHDFNCVINRSIEDDIFLDGKAAQIRRQVLSHATHAWKLGELMALIQNLVEKFIRTSLTTLSDIKPNLLKVGFRLRCDPGHIHDATSFAAELST